MPKVSRSYLDTRRREILEAALACFARNGFHQTTVEDIAKEAGVSHGAIYRYFDSKAEMVRATAMRDQAARHRRLDEAGRAPTVPEALARVLATAGELQPGPEAAARRRLSAQVFGEAVREPALNAAVLEIWDDVADRLASMVRRGQASGAIAADLEPTAVARVLGAIHSGFVVHAANDPKFDLGSSLEVVAALIENRFAA